MTYLELLAALPNISVPGIEASDCQFLGGFAKSLGSLHLSHAVLEAASSPTTYLVTSRRDLVTKILPSEWPLIDVPPQDAG